MPRDDDEIEDDDEPKPSRYRRPKKTSPVLWILLAGVGFGLLVCCGAGGYFAYKGKSGGGGLGYAFTITGGTIKAKDLPEGKYAPILTLDFQANLAADAEYVVVVQSHYARRSPGRDVTPAFKPTGGRFTGTITGEGMPATPCDVWIERRSGGTKTIVSNVFVID